MLDGFSIGGPVGAVVGATIGAGIGLWIIHEMAEDGEQPYINEDGTVKDKPAEDENCEKKGKVKCEGYGQYDQVGTPKHVRRGSIWYVAYGKSEALAAEAWKKKVQNASPPGFTARHIKPRCKKVK